MTRVADLPAVGWEETLPSDPLEVIRQKVQALVSDDRADSVDEVRTLLVQAREEPRLPALLHELLGEGHVERVRDSQGNTLRFVLVDVLLELGFPHALEVNPDDLDYHRYARRERIAPGQLLAGLTVGAAVVSTGWSGLWTVVLLGSPASARELWWVSLPLLLAIGHGVSAVVTSARALSDRPERRKAVAPLKKLAWAGLIGVASIALAAVTPGNGAAYLATIVASLPLLTAASCGLTAWRVSSDRKG